MTQPARRRPGPAPSLSREQVVDAALEVMQSQGLNAVSFRSVAGALGVNPMALYTYVRDKDELLALMYDRVCADIAFDDDSDAPAVDQLLDYYVVARAVLLRNVDLYRLVRRPDLPGLDLRTAERMCQLLVGLGMGPAEVARIQTRLLQYTIGNALYTASLRAVGDGADLGTWAGRLAEQISAEDQPHLHATAEAMRDYDEDLEFAEGLRSILQGTGS
jgi:TetR/AcrR family transcriptional regulator, tetracycline repressor protein